MPPSRAGVAKAKNSHTTNNGAGHANKNEEITNQRPGRILTGTITSDRKPASPQVNRPPLATGLFMPDNQQSRTP